MGKGLNDEQQDARIEAAVKARCPKSDGVATRYVADLDFDSLDEVGALCNVLLNRMLKLAQDREDAAVAGIETTEPEMKQKQKLVLLTLLAGISAVVVALALMHSRLVPALALDQCTQLG